ncbi:MAG: FAD-binding protein [Deltaproteobacteria bacterium]|jgi:UDP-N-acetylmuramate dehydrogenase|nr:FAD-binding protein [Deltaproteobacteria bacterium]
MEHKGLRVSAAPPLAELTSIRLGGAPLARVQVEDERACSALPETLRSLGGRPVVLGRGSNILAGPGPLPLVLLELGESFKKQKLLVLEEDECKVTLKASAAMPLPLFLHDLAELGLGGLSGLAGIPGALGGAVAMNAGSFGHEMADCLRTVRLFSPGTGLVTLEQGEWQAGYRNFTLPALSLAEGGDGWFIITELIFRCPRMKAEDVRRHMRLCLEQKYRAQPVHERSAGCVFKNPPEGPAGRLMEECGLKGRRKGGISFSELHANFLLNDGQGRPEEALELMEEARAEVLKRHGARLETEVRLWV